MLKFSVRFLITSDFADTEAADGAADFWREGGAISLETEALLDFISAGTSHIKV
jgi:hypothetical protein